MAWSQVDFFMPDETWGPPPPQGTRKRVNDYVASHPGTHARRIGKELGLSRGDLQYHLYILEKEGLIKTRRRGLYKFVFPSRLFGEKQEVVLSLLSQETPSEILLFLIQNPDSTQTDLVEHLRFSAATVSWHMDRMVKEGVVARKKAGKFVEYRVTVSADDMIQLVKEYHPTLWERWADRFADIMFGLGRTEGGSAEMGKD
jgi:predicted transcriptional regulator